jgi:hypothetical protein
VLFGYPVEHFADFLRAEAVAGNLLQGFQNIPLVYIGVKFNRLSPALHDELYEKIEQFPLGESAAYLLLQERLVFILPNHTGNAGKYLDVLLPDFPLAGYNQPGGFPPGLAVLAGVFSFGQGAASHLQSALWGQSYRNPLPTPESITRWIQVSHFGGGGAIVIYLSGGNGDGDIGFNPSGIF